MPKEIVSGQPKWSPGPWGVSEESRRHDSDLLIVLDANEEGVCIIEKDDVGPGTEYANAGLIASAPELYEALEESCMTVETLLLYASDGIGMGMTLNKKRVREFVTKHRAILAKARDESQSEATQ